ncbi:DUF6443 domain-containing protein [Aquimarina sp. 2201CG5-10]|uniref:DUF6443 domain-containing protein n=1 Tax=Aquimarina callyspongiae TaxID=3098150 RepID=UPI002AB5C97F|nr:DUF6443 domain-containing protein [Aquimarina sp. 2201CG5-10]MDY8137076.1 DUF6443 domain-containing protein [Aquimarina sp. 2201CG5-10]
MQNNIYTLSRMLCLLCLLLSTTISKAQQRELIESIESEDRGKGSGGRTVQVNITGQNNVNLNDTNTYRASASGLALSSGRWHVQGATIIDQNTTTVTIKWTSTGNKYIDYVGSTTRGGLAEGFYRVTVNEVAPAMPTNPIIASQDCNQAVLQKNGNTPSGVTWYWQGTNNNGTSTSNANTTYSATTSGKYYLRARSNSGTWSIKSSYIDVTLGIIGGTTWYADTDGDGLGDPNATKVQCTQPQGYVSNANDQCPTEHGGGTVTGCPCVEVTWYADTDGDGLGDLNDTVVQCTQPLGYVSNSDDSCPTTHGEGNADGCPSIELSNENYVYTIVPQKAVSDIANLTKNEDAIKNITYFDGLGRAKQAIAINQSSSEKDIVTHIEYDDLGRQNKEYLPYPSLSSGGGIKTGTKNATQAYYKTAYSQDFPGITDINLITSYSEKEFDNSPLNRVTKQAAPGTDWQLGNGHEIEFEYNTNSLQEVRKYAVTTVLTGTTYIPSLQDNDTHYGVGTLYKMITKDENHTDASGKLHTTAEFKNKQGQVVLKRTYAKVNNIVTDHDTYYVYDDYGNLTYVIPPKVNTADGISDTELAELCYQYVYDNRNRLVEKKIPGKGWEYIVYDRLDRHILTQDAEQRAKNNKEWLFTKYDQLGRVIYTGIYKDNRTRTEVQTSANDSDKTSESYVGTTEPNTLFFYTDHAFPTGIPYYDVYTINYYDKYVYWNADARNPATNSFGVALTDRIKGLTTTSKVKVLGTSESWITTITGYDQKARPVYVYSKNDYLQTTTITESKLDFVGKVLKTKTKHTKNGNADIVIIDTFTHDHTGRLEKQSQKINNQAEEVIFENTYDELGQLQNKGVGGKVDQNRLQSVDYKYNVRGWLKEINNPDDLTNDLFAFGINYNSPTHQGTALFNGNIAETKWKTASDNSLRWYRYSYDALNRIKSGIDNLDRYSLSSIAYDKNGNITSLQRKGHINEQATHFGLMDNLQYTYVEEGNKLTRVQELPGGNTTYGFKDSANLTTEYTYDQNGNMTSDANKGVTGITYNHLNLPNSVSVSNITTYGNIQYIYDATGTKLKKTVTQGSSVTTTEYAGNYIYKNGQLEFLNHPEGYIEPNGLGGFEYVYQYTDHLGNIRLSYSDRDGDYQNIVASSFTNDMEGWLKGDVETEITNGRLKVTVNGQWEGIRHELSDIAVQPGDQFTVQCTFDKGNTNAKVRLYIRERDSDGNHLLYTGLDYDLQTGTYSIPYTVQAGNKISLHIDKDDTYTNETTYFYVDEVSFSKGNLTIHQEKNYYPFGLRHKGYNNAINGTEHPYGYNGKEENNEVGLEWLDYGARNYEANLGRWMNVDPLAEKYHSISPYAYVANNLINAVDPDGRDIVYINKNGKEAHRIKSDEVFQTHIQTTNYASVDDLSKGWKQVPMPNIIQTRTATGEDVSDSKYQENDYFIAARTGYFNQGKENGTLKLYTEGGNKIPSDVVKSLPDLDPTLVKAIAIQESHAGVKSDDILTANNPGDWGDGKLKSAYGMKKSDDLNATKSLYYGIRILATKGFKGGVTYDKNTGVSTFTFKGWSSATHNYNGNGVKNYKSNVKTMVNESKKPKSSNY